jgi:hypothetical protein
MWDDCEIFSSYLTENTVFSLTKTRLVMFCRKVIAVYLWIIRKLFSLLKQVVFRVRYLGVRGTGLRSRYIATVWGIEPRRRRDFQYPFRPSLSPTQPPIQWVPGLSRG